MRRLLITLVIVLLGGSLLAWLVQQESGYVLIAIGTTTIEMNLWGTVLLLLGLLLVIYLLKHAVSSLRGLAQLKQVRQRRLRVQTARGFMQYMEGRWDSARKLLEKSAARAQIPTLNYLAAANAAYEQGDYPAVSHLLDRADILASGEDLAVGITRARLSLRSGHYQQALAELQPLVARAAKHPYVLRLQEQAYRGLRDWHSLERLLPQCQRNKAYSKAEFFALQVEVYEQLLHEITAQCEVDSGAMRADVWQEIPSQIKYTVQIVVAYAKYLAVQNEVDKAEKLLRKAINRHWDDRLVVCYGEIAASDSLRQLGTAESWLADHDDNAQLLMALGLLSKRAELWGKARDYLESALTLSPDPVIYIELAQLLSRLGEADKSSECYRHGLLAAVESKQLVAVVAS